MAERLDKFLAGQLGITRSSAKALAKSGRITVNSKIVKSAEMKISEAADNVAVDGNAIIYRKYMYIMLNKPQGVVCSTKDGLSPTVLSLVPSELMREGLFPAGRLDKDTEGFVLLTDDGGLSHSLLSPKKHVPKLYYARLLRPYSSDYEKRFSEGLEIDGGEVCLPAEIRAGEGKDDCFVTLHEGKYHQIKRMLAALGNEVVYLKRLRIGGLDLDQNLPIGECREISQAELSILCTI